MGDYHKRRWDWTVRQSLQRVRWDSTEAVVVSLAILIVPAFLAFLALGSLDLLVKGLLAIAATLIVLVALLVVNWLRAPEALDLERARTIETLKEQLAEAKAATDATSGHSYSRSQLQTIRNAVSVVRVGVELLRDVSSVSVDPAYRQIVSVFRDAGWTVHDWVSMDEPPRPHGDITLYVGEDTLPDALNCILAGFQAAQIPLEIRRDDPGVVVMPRLIFSEARS